MLLLFVCFCFVFVFVCIFCMYLGLLFFLYVVVRYICLFLYVLFGCFLGFFSFVVIVAAVIAPHPTYNQYVFYINIGQRFQPCLVVTNPLLDIGTLK